MSQCPKIIILSSRHILEKFRSSTMAMTDADYDIVEITYLLVNALNHHDTVDEKIEGLVKSYLHYGSSNIGSEPTYDGKILSKAVETYGEGLKSMFLSMNLFDEKGVNKYIFKDIVLDEIILERRNN